MFSTLNRVEVNWTVVQIKMGQRGYKQNEKKATSGQGQLESELTHRQHWVLCTCAVSWRVGRRWQVAHCRRVCDGILNQKDKSRRFTSKHLMSCTCAYIIPELDISIDLFTEITSRARFSDNLWKRKCLFWRKIFYCRFLLKTGSEN